MQKIKAERSAGSKDRLEKDRRTDAIAKAVVDYKAKWYWRGRLPQSTPRPASPVAFVR